MNEYLEFEIFWIRIEYLEFTFPVWIMGRVISKAK
jgi:hypothetical protein